MKITKLTMLNAYRVIMIRRADHSDNAPIQFHYREIKIGYCNYDHLIGANNDKILPACDFGKWEIVEFPRARYLENLLELAYTAYRKTSENPDECGKSAITLYENELHEDLMSIPVEEQTRYLNSYRIYLANMLSAKTRCDSAAVVGTSNFDCDRNTEAIIFYEKVYIAFREWRTRALKEIEKANQPQQTQEQKNQEIWKRMRDDIDYIFNYILVSYGYQSFLVMYLLDRIRTMAKNGEVELVEKSVARIRDWNTKIPKPIIPQRHFLFRLPEITHGIRQRMEE